MSLTDSLLAALTLLLAAGLVAAAAGDLQNRTEAEEAGRELAVLAKAMERCLAQQGPALMAELSGGEPADIPLKRLVRAGFLPAGFPERNAWGQRYRILLAPGARQDDGQDDGQRNGQNEEQVEGTEARAPRLPRVLALAEGTVRTRETAFFLSRVIPAAARNAGGWHVPGRELRKTMGIRDADTLAGRGGLRIRASSLGIPALPEGSLGILLDFPANVAEAGPNAPETYLARVAQAEGDSATSGNAAMATALDAAAHRTDHVSSLTLTPLSRGLLSLGDGTIADSLDLLRERCAAPAGNAESLEGLTVIDTQSAVWTCRNHRLEALLDSGNAVTVKGITAITAGDMLPDPAHCPAGHVSAAYALPMAAEGAGRSPLCRFDAAAAAAYAETGESSSSVTHLTACSTAGGTGAPCEAMSLRTSLVITACVPREEAGAGNSAGNTAFATPGTGTRTGGE